jgi:hypothetical protein
VADGCIVYKVRNHLDLTGDGASKISVRYR